MSDTLKISEDKMNKTLKVLANEFSSIRAGRANPAVLDRVMVDYYGAPTSIQQLAAVSVAESRILTIAPWDKSALQAIEKAIQKSDIGINPTNDGTIIRIVFPQPTEERRRELCKTVGKVAEDAKIAIRSIRRDANDSLKNQKKKNEITEDEQKVLEKDIQNLTDRFVKKIDEMAADKETEILEI